jgi:hypothetical protein
MIIVVGNDDLFVFLSLAERDRQQVSGIKHSYFCVFRNRRRCCIPFRNYYHRRHRYLLQRRGAVRWPLRRENIPCLRGFLAKRFVPSSLMYWIVHNFPSTS